MTWDITGAARVGVYIPRASHFRTGFVDGEGVQI